MHLPVMVSCISLPKAAEPDDDIQSVADTSWSAIVGAIRAYAHAQPAEVQSDLLQWADFLSGIAEMQDKANSTD